METSTRRVRANGIDIHISETGRGPPLLLLHGGMVSTDPMWKGIPVAYTSFVPALAEHFRVIAPDTRGSGKTAHSGGPISYDLLADDVVALSAALELNRPAICGFSDGGTIATVVGIKHPGAVRAIVNDAGYDMFEPTAKVFTMGRQVFGGKPDATKSDPEAAARAFGSAPPMAAVFEQMKRDQDANGPGWKAYLEMTFERFTSSPGYTFEDFRRITASTLLLVGDRDMFCTVEDAARALRCLTDGELCVVPNVGHVITPSAIDATIEFLRRKAG